MNNPRRIAWFGTAALILACLILLLATTWGRATLAATGARLAGLFGSAEAAQTASQPASPAALSTASPRKILYYVDPMHPSYKSDKPGIAPDCGMQLVPVYASDTTAGSPPAETKAMRPSERGPVQISVAQERLIGLTTARAEYRTLSKTLRAVGTVAVDETRIGQVHTRISGWVQKVFVDYTTQQVRKGDPLFTIYSQDLVATEQEYLLALKGQRELAGSAFQGIAGGADSLVEAARQRLLQWDLSPEQIEEIRATNQVKRDITLFSPLTGVVTERKAFPNQYVTPDMALYTVADYSHVWVNAELYEPEIEFARVGQSATFTTDAYRNRAFRGTISYILPQMDAQTRTLKVRMDFANADGALKPDMYGNVELDIPLGRRLVVPDSSVLDSGTRQLIFVQKAPGTLEPRDVEVGLRANGYAEIRKGLKAGEVVASSATFLIDSESQLRAALAGMTLGTGVTGIGGQLGVAAGGAAEAQLQITFHTQPEPPHSGKARVNVTVRDAAGKPVDGAHVKVTFYMPAMPSMGMPSMRSEAALSPQGSGQYSGEIEIRTPGTWQVTVDVEKGGKALGAGQFTVRAE
ncbi:MAG: FixH family protein [Acidobacteriia bacterium]|nr:FixH family protein [Terriglobia bacterium]